LALATLAWPRFAATDREVSVSTEDARKLVVRVATDPALLRRLVSVADRGESDPSACAELAKMVAELDPNVSIQDCQAVRAELGSAADASALQSTLPGVDHDQIAKTAAAEGMDVVAWVQRASYACANICSA
jgi:hypothetical protein